MNIFRRNGVSDEKEDDDMADVFDYLVWRGDLLFAKAGHNPVDALIFSTLSYIDYSGIVSESPHERIFLRDAARIFFEKPDAQSKVRVKNDLALLQMAGETERFGNVGLCYYRTVFDVGEETQFAAITYLLDDGSAVIAFRGTDRTLVGWKEDFNMSFQDSIPAQREALRYVDDFVVDYGMPLRLVGHSKGGNLAVYAAAKGDEVVKEQIVEIHNQDGPGFSEKMMTDPGYLAVVPKIHTFVPQSSVVGRLLEHEEPYTVIRSKSIGPLQHDPYSWEVLRKDFIYLEEITENTRFVNQTLKSWLAGMSIEERNTLVDVIFDILAAGGVSSTKDLMHPKNVRNYARTLSMDEKKRQVIGEGLADLIQAIKDTQQGGI